MPESKNDQEKAAEKSQSKPERKKAEQPSACGCGCTPTMPVKP